MCGGTRRIAPVYKVGDKVVLWDVAGYWLDGVVTHVYEDGNPRVKIGKYEAQWANPVEPAKRRFPLVVNGRTAMLIEALAGEMSVTDYVLSLIRQDAARRAVEFPDDPTPRRGKRGNGRRKKDDAK